MAVVGRNRPREGLPMVACQAKRLFVISAASFAAFAARSEEVCPLKPKPPQEGHADVASMDV
eukprot:4095739-Heterocapsa_arctica.AAC.1